MQEQVGAAFRMVAKAEGPETSTLLVDNVAIGWMQFLRQLQSAKGRALTGRDGLETQHQERGNRVE